jgi:hypothetical protein
MKKPATYLDLHEVITCGVRGCNTHIKLNIIENANNANRKFTCYLHGMLEKGKTFSNGKKILDLLEKRKKGL